MSATRVRLPEDWQRFDKIGIFGAMILPALLLMLWLTGFGPQAYQACQPSAEVAMRADAGKVTLTGRVADIADRKTLVDAARAAYGETNVVDKLTIDGGVAPLAWARSATALVKRMKAVGPVAAMTIAGDKATVEGEVADKAARDSAMIELSNMLGGKVVLKDGLTLRAAAPPPPKKEPAPVVAAPVAPPPPPPVPVAAPRIAKGSLGAYKLPDGTEISILGEGLESQVLAFLEDRSRQIDKGLWFDFDRLHFKTGSAELTPESKAQIDTLVAILKAYPASAVKIGGYTDNVGDPTANLKLSGTRAERVAEQIVALGITADRVEAEGYGEQHPIASNETAEGRARNRRTALSVRRK